MTVDESVAMLTARGLTVTRRDFSTEREYYASLGWPTKHAKDHPVTLLIAENPHHAKHLRFQWNHENGGSRLYDMAFGDYDYELFIMDVPDEGGLEWLEEMVDEVLRGDIHVITYPFPASDFQTDKPSFFSSLFTVVPQRWRQ